MDQVVFLIFSHTIETQIEEFSITVEEMISVHVLVRRQPQRRVVLRSVELDFP